MMEKEKTGLMIAWLLLCLLGTIFLGYCIWGLESNDPHVSAGMSFLMMHRWWVILALGGINVFILWIYRRGRSK